MMDFIKEYKKKGLLKEEAVGFDQISNYLKRANKDLSVAEANLKIDSEASYNYAYLAMLRAGRALIFSFGLRPTDGVQHKTTVEFCELILKNKISDTVAYFDLMRKKRNRFTYDEPGLAVSEAETFNALNQAKLFVKTVGGYIQEKNPQQKLL